MPCSTGIFINELGEISTSAGRCAGWHTCKQMQGTGVPRVIGIRYRGEIKQVDEQHCASVTEAPAIGSSAGSADTVCILTRPDWGLSLKSGPIAYSNVTEEAHLLVIVLLSVQ